MAEEENLTQEQKEGMAKVAKANWESEQLKYLAAESFLEQYGPRFKQGADALIAAGAQMTPSDEVYQQIYLPQLLNSDGTIKKDGAITTPYLQQSSFIILQRSLASMKISDLMKYVGVKGELPRGLEGQYVSDLGDEQAGQIVQMTMQYQAGEMAKDVIGLEQTQISGGLEKMLIPQEEEKQAA